MSNIIYKKNWKTGNRFENTYEDGYCIIDNKTDLLYHVNPNDEDDFVRNKLIDLLNELDENNS